MARPNISNIRKAVCEHHGGFADATQGQIMTVWNSLDGETRKQYLGALEEQKTEGGGQKSKGTNAGGTPATRKK